MNAPVMVLGATSHSPAKNQAEPATVDPFLRTILDTLPVGVCWQRCGADIGCWVNEAFARLSGRSGETFADIDSLANFLNPADRAAYAAGLTQLRTKQASRLSLELRCEIEEEDNWRELTMQAFRAADGMLSHLVLTLTDISERKQHEEEMQRAVESADSLSQQVETAIDRAQQSAVEANLASMAIRQLAVLDELTGLYNRRGYNTLNPDVIEQVKSTDLRGFLCYFDLDRFKQINDELGHAKGDEALIEFSATLRTIFSKDTLLVRLGGDEFVAMGVEQLPGQTSDALRALETLLSLRNAKESSEFNLEASAGVTYFDKSGPHSIEELTTAADAELYHCKETRRRARAPSQTEPPTPRGHSRASILFPLPPASPNIARAET